MRKYPLLQMSVASYTPAGDRLQRSLLNRVSGDVQLQVADETTDALKNEKGLILTVLCVVGLGVCGLVFVMGLTLLGSAVEDFWTLLTTFGSAGIGALTNTSVSDLATVLALLWFVVGLVTVPFVYALYGLVYWYQQLRRLPSYATYWERYWQADPERSLAGNVRRPAGLMLPGSAILVPMFGVVWITSNQSQASMPVVVGYDLLWSVGVCIVAWSVFDTVGGQPQSLAHEGRELLLALLLQLGTIGLVAPAIGSVSTSGLFVGGALSVLLVGLIYFPEIGILARRTSGITAALDLVYAGVLFGIALATTEMIWDLPTDVYVIIVLVFSLWISMKYYDQFADAPVT